jgi:hypothetical protein
METAIHERPQHALTPIGFAPLLQQISCGLLFHFHGLVVVVGVSSTAHAIVADAGTVQNVTRLTGAASTPRKKTAAQR